MGIIGNIRNQFRWIYEMYILLNDEELIINELKVFFVTFSIIRFFFQIHVKVICGISDVEELNFLYFYKTLCMKSSKCLKCSCYKIKDCKLQLFYIHFKLCIR